jgi:GxxExxY protein
MPYENEDPPYVEPDPELDQWTGATIGAGIEVHKQLGPGLDESLYAAAMARELRLRGIPFEREVIVEVRYKGELIGTRRIDLIVAGKIVVELKTVESLAQLHKAQVRTYLKITGLKIGLLINFNSIMLKDGIKRIINPC